MLEQLTDRKASLERLFRPQSVAVVGASPSHRWGRQSLENFRKLDFPGEVAAINPKYEEIIGFPCYPSLRNLPFVPDAVLVGVNRGRAVDVVVEAAEVGAKGAVVFAIGFAEAGLAGLRMQNRLADAASRANMAVIGPNCQGYINFCHPSALYMDVVHPYEPGYCALFSESGSVTAALTNNKRGVRWSHIVSCGNEAVCDSSDLLSYFVDDPHTTVICAFLETIRSPERFFAECERAMAAGKPVVVLKSGRTEAARNMVVTHSGSLSPSDRLIDELFRRYGVLRVESMEELLETAIALQGRRPHGNRVAAVTASGGQIELILDETGKHGFQHPALASQTQEYLHGVLPDFLPTSNPLDYWGITDYEAAYPGILHALAADPNVDIVVGIADANHGPTGDEGQDVSQRATAAEIAAETDKVIAMITTLDGSATPAAVEESLARNVLFLSGIPMGFKALERLVTYSSFTVAPPLDGSLDGVELERIVDEMDGHPTAGTRALDMLAAAGIPVAQHAVARDADAAASAAERIGYPVVAKIGDSDALHKTDSGGVILDLRDEAAVRDAFRRLKAAGADRVMIQAQVPSGVELILGLQSDPSLGTFVLAGIGGIWTEVLNDVAIRPTGLRAGEAAGMLNELRSQRLLDGVRGAPSVDRASIVRAIEVLDFLARQFGPRLESIDINPLVATPEGVIAVDAVVVPRSLYA
ncbi:MAG: acetate--CoA ligase family protein [Chloroflexota bacterium]|nr:acetate--CoA ligase family protein [Chloroflexota bacterium]